MITRLLLEYNGKHKTKCYHYLANIIRNKTDLVFQIIWLINAVGTYLLDVFNNEIIANSVTNKAGRNLPYYHCLEILIEKRKEQSYPVNEDRF